MGTRPDEIAAGGHLGGRGDHRFPDTDAAADTGSDETAQIRANIEHTRTEMSETIDALQERLSPSRIVEQVKEQVREQVTEAYDTAKEAVRDATIGKAERVIEKVSGTVNEMTQRAGLDMRGTGSSVMDTIRQHPLPLALIGAGLTMLYRSRDRGQSSGSGYRDYRDYTDRDYRDRDDRLAEYARTERYSAEGPVSYRSSSTEEQSSGVQEKLSSAVGSLKETASSLADRTREQAGALQGQARRSVRKTGETFQSLLHDNPLAVGAAAVAIGVVVGLSVPETQTEREYMGEARDQLVDKAQNLAKDTFQKVQKVAQEAGQTVQKEAQNQGLTSGS